MALADEPSALRAYPKRPSARENHASRPPSPLQESPEWALVQRIAGSSGFVRSALLTRFLLYVSELTLSGRSIDLNERHIGIHVFGRDDSFKRTDDNIVRNYARILRKRIDNYFLQEGQEEALRLYIPKGGYVPVFERRKTELKPDATPEPKPEPLQELATEAVSGLAEILKVPSAADKSQASSPLPGLIQPAPIKPPSFLPAIEIAPRLQRRFLWPALMLVLGLSAGFALSTFPSLQVSRWLHPESKNAQLYRQFWKSLFSPDRATVLVPSDGGLVILHRFIESPSTLTDYVSGKYRSPEVIGSGLRELTHTTSNTEIPELSRKVESLGDRRYTSMVDLDLTARLSHVPEAIPERLMVRFARDLRMDDLKTDNLVLIGSLDSNPWVELFQQQLNFQFNSGGPFGGSATIVNRHPLPGEAATYASVTGDPAKRTYGVVAYLPNLDGTGHVVMLEGINMAGTQAAGEFLLNQDRMAPIIARARKPNGQLRSFEVLINTNDVAASSSQLTVLSERYGS